MASSIPAGTVESLSESFFTFRNAAVLHPPPVKYTSPAV